MSPTLPRIGFVWLLTVVTMVSSFSCASPAPPPPLAVGSMVAPTSIEDQYGVEHALDASVRVVLFSRDMGGGAIIREVLAADPTILDRANAVYLADISGMPTLIANTMAIPKMRKRSYATLLDRTGETTAAFPAEEGKATVLVLEALEVSSIRLVGSADELRAALGEGLR